LAALRAELSNFLKLKPGFTVKALIAVGHMFSEQIWRTAEGLRKAGLEQRLRLASCVRAFFALNFCFRKISRE